MPEEITICPMNEPDLREVLAIESDSFPHPWSVAHFQNELASPYSFPMVVLDHAGAVAGYICPMLLLDEGHILNVAVARQHRGRGVGRLLVEAALRECREKDASFVSLEVRTSNVNAISLYRSLGFIETGLRKRYYENGEDALLMEFIYEKSEENSDAVHIDDHFE